MYDGVITILERAAAQLYWKRHDRGWDGDLERAQNELRTSCCQRLRPRNSYMKDGVWFRALRQHLQTRKHIATYFGIEHHRLNCAINVMGVLRALES